MLQWRGYISLVVFCMVLLTAQNAYALRCDGGLIGEGDAMLVVRNKCGEPAWVDRWVEQVVDLPDTDFEHRVSRVNERWIYNFGPTRFLRIVSFRDSKVLSIETGGRGFARPPTGRQCNFGVLSLGTTSLEVRAQCGQPDQAAQRFETVTEKLDSGRREITVSVDEWTYNLGPSRFMRVLLFRNGELVDIHTGDKGFD